MFTSEYIIVSSKTVPGLETQVNSKLDEGFELHGDVFTKMERGPYEDALLMFQPMIRRGIYPSQKYTRK